MTREQVEQAKIILKAIDELEEHLKEVRAMDDGNGTAYGSIYFKVGNNAKGPVFLDPAFMFTDERYTPVGFLNMYTNMVQAKIYQLEQKLKDI